MAPTDAKPTDVKPTDAITPPTTAEPSIADLRKMRDAGWEEPAATPAAAEVKPPAEPAPAEPKPAEEPPAAAAEPEAKTEPEPEPGEKQEPERDEQGRFTPKTEEKVPAGVQKRIDKAVAKQRDAERRLGEVERKLAEIQGSHPAGEPEKPAEPARPTTEAAEPLLKDFVEKHETYEDAQQAWIKAHETWAHDKWEQESAAKQAKRQAEERQQTLTTKWNARAALAREATPDFDDAVEKIGPFLSKAGVADLVMDSELGPEIVLYLHQHPDETLSLAKTGDARAIARAIGRLEAKLAKPAPETKAQTPAKTAAPAKTLPKPPASVGGGGAPAAVDLETCDMRTFKKAVRPMLESS